MESVKSTMIQSLNKKVDYGTFDAVKESLHKKVDHDYFQTFCAKIKSDASNLVT
jgi:hypothetical protein